MGYYTKDLSTPFVFHLNKLQYVHVIRYGHYKSSLFSQNNLFLKVAFENSNFAKNYLNLS